MFCLHYHHKTALRQYDANWSASSGQWFGEATKHRSPLVSGLYSAPMSHQIGRTIWPIWASTSLGGGCRFELGKPTHHHHEQHRRHCLTGENLPLWVILAVRPFRWLLAFPHSLLFAYHNEFIALSHSSAITATISFVWACFSWIHSYLLGLDAIDALCSLNEPWFCFKDHTLRESLTCSRATKLSSTGLRFATCKLFCCTSPVCFTASSQPNELLI